MLFALVSATAAGIHEIVWSGLFGRAVGNTSIGLGVTLAVFMAGSGLGAWVGPRLRLVEGDPRRALMGFEACVALGAGIVAAYCLSAPSPSAVFGLDGVFGQGIDILAVALVSALPAFAIGATYPVLVELVVRERASATRITLLYAAGLIGVVVGTMGAAMGLAPRLGLDGSAVVASLLNLIALALAARLPRPARETERGVGEDDAQLAWPLAAFAGAGALGLGAQVVWNRVVTPYAGVATLTFACVVAIYLLAQAIGFLGYRRLAPERRDPVGVYAFLAAGPIACLSLTLLSTVDQDAPNRDMAPGSWTLFVVTTVALVVAPPAIALGLSQAAALGAVERAKAAWGRQAARIVAIGTIVAAATALASSIVGIPGFGPRGTLLALALVPAIIALAMRRATLLVAGTSAALACIPVLASWGPPHLLGPAFDAAPMLYAHHGIQDTVGVITVDQPAEPRIRRLVANGVSYSGDSVFAQRYMRALAHLPAAAARHRGRGLVICVGTGITLDALRMHEFQTVTAVDISPDVFTTLSYFSHVNGRVHESDEITWVIDDGARYLRRTGETFDVITVEPPPPRAPGGTTLYTRDFYRAARARMTDGGALAQWVPLHGLSAEEVGAIIATFTDAFPVSSLHMVERNEAVLVGIHGRRRSTPAAVSREAAIDLERIGYIDEVVSDSLVLADEELASSVEHAPRLRDAWPAPEYAPWALAGRAEQPLDGLLDAMWSVRGSRTPDATSGARFLRGAGAFNRIQEGRGSAADRRLVRGELLALLAQSPENAYVQHMFGFGALLEDRLERLGLTGQEIAVYRAAMSERRSQARRAIDDALP